MGVNPSDPLQKHFPRLKPDQKRALQKLGIVSVRDLLYHFPARYSTTGPQARTGELSPGTEATLIGVIRKPDIRKTWKTRRPIAEAYLEDAGGKIKLMWFSQPYIAKTLADGMVVKVRGRVAGSGAKLYLANPVIERGAPSEGAPSEGLFMEDEGAGTSPEEAERLMPIYPESAGISSLWLFYALKRVFAAGAHTKIEDPIPEEIRARYHLPGLENALILVHHPKKPSDAEAARKRFAFEEVFALQLIMQRKRAETARTAALPVEMRRDALDAFVRSFPFPATAAQKRAIEAIVEDFERPHPMRRLLEGDVGSGKTAVAAATAYAVATTKPQGRIAGTLQVAYLCPTEILAKQHFATFISYFKEHPIQIGLITGKECRKFPSKVRHEESAHLSRAAFQKMVANGELPIVIGTHAVVEKSLSFKHLAYAIIDEQHRFGVSHRRELAVKDGSAPHLLSMTATPIPRTLALTLYGDLDITLLDEMPVGRKPVITEVLPKTGREEAYARVRSELAHGRQAYVICPRIEEPDPQKELALQAKSVAAEAKRLAKEVFPNVAIGTLHGKMTPKEKEEAMRLFSENETRILVATSVVEVGVNVPNAAVILIEGAERFGLSQLHQLRGRVLRSTHQAYCYALPELWGAQTRERMRAFTRAKNGFELAEYDLALRGAGELSGGKQWGVSDVAMDALKNLKLVEAARGEAARLTASDPELGRHPALRTRVLSAEHAVHLE